MATTFLSSAQQRTPLVHRSIRTDQGEHNIGPFVGRTVEITEIERLIRAWPVVTLTGAPGIGKSRLALESAHVLSPDLADRAVTVPLADIRPSEVRAVVCEALGDQPSPLLILDDCDLSVSACADLVTELLATGNRAIRVLATSRQPLGLDTAVERVWRVPSLSVPEPEDDGDIETLARFEAVKLFCLRAAAVDPAFSLTAINAVAVADTCRMLDGIPLALELAAGRLNTIPPETIASNLNDPLTLLVDDSLRQPARHQSLRRALESSTERLTPHEAALWRRLSVFPASFTDEGASEVCRDRSLEASTIPDLLADLASKSLLVVDTTRGATRFRLLQAIRCMAWEALEAAKEVDSVAERHLQWCVTVVDRAGDPRLGLPWLERLTPDAESLEAALSRTAAERIEEAARIGSAHVILCEAAGRHDEAHAWLGSLTTITENAPAALRATALRHLGLAAGLIGEIGTAISTLHQSAAAARAAGNLAGAVRALNLVGFVSMLAGDYAGGLVALDQTVALARLLGDRGGLGEALAAAGRAHILLGDPAGGRRRFSEFLAEARRAGDETAAANAFVGLGWAALMQDDEVGAETALCNGLALARRLGDSNATATALVWLGNLALTRGNLAEARSTFEESAAIARDAGTPCPLGHASLGLGRLALSQGEFDLAYGHFSEALEIARNANISFLVGPALRGVEEAAAASDLG